MPTSRIEIIVDGKDGASGVLRDIGRSMDDMGNHAGRMGGALGRMGEIAGGILGAQAIMGLGRAVGGAVKDAFEATASYEKLGMALENLSKKDLLRAGTATKMVQVGTQEVSQTGKNAAAIADLNLKRDVMMAKMKEQQERHRQLIAKWGEEGLAVKTHAAQMAVDQAAIDKVNQKIAELGAAGTKTVGVYKQVTEQFISDAEAKEMAAKTSKELLGWIEQLAIKSPFTQEGVQSAFKTAMAYGFITDQAADLMLKTGQLDEKQRANTVTAQRLTQAMIDFAAGAGLGPETMDRVALALGQIQARGKLAGQEVMQLTEAGISVDAILAKAFGKSTQEIVAMREKGLIPADQAILAITQSLETDFGGAAAAQTQTFAGLVSSLSDIKTIGLREFFTGTFEALQPYLAGFTDWVGGIIPKLSEFGATLGGAVATALQTVSGLVQSFQTGGVGGLLGALGLPPEAVAMVQNVTTNLQTLATVVQGFFSTLAGGGMQLASVKTSLAEMDAGLPGLVSNVMFLGSTFGQTIRQVVGSFTTDWGPAWRLAQMTVQQTIDSIRSIVVSVLSLVTGSIADHATQLKALFFEAYGRVQQIVGQVLGAVQLIVSTVLGAVQTFIQAHGDEIRTFLGNAWEQIGRIINLALQMIQATVVPLLQGIARFIASHSEEIQRILGGAWTIIKNVIGGALDLIEGILKTALQIFKGDWSGAWETIKQTLSSVWDKIKGVIGGALDILDTLFGGWLDKIKQWFTDKFNDILEWMRALPDKLKEIGNNMIQGLIDGIAEAASDLIAYIENLFGDVIAIAKSILGIASPSTVFELIGLQIMQGLMEGMQAGTPAAAAAMAASLSAIMDAISKVIGVIGALANLSDLANVSDKLRLLSDEIKAIVTAFRILAQYFGRPGSGLDSAKAVLDPLASVFEKIASVINGLASLLSLDVIATTTDKIMAVIALLRTALPALVNALADAARGMTGPAMLAAAALAETGAAIGSSLQAIVAGFTAVADYVPHRIGPTLNIIIDQLRGLIRKFARAAPEFAAEGLAAAATFAQAGAAIAGQLQAMVAGFTAVADYVPKRIGPTLNVMIDQLRGLIRKFARAAPEFAAEGLAAATAFAQAGGAIAGQLSAMVEGFKAVAGYGQTDPLSSGFQMFADDAHLLVQEIVRAAADFDAKGLEAAKLFASAMGAIGGEIDKAIEGIRALVGYGLADPVLSFQMFADDAHLLVQEIVRVADTFDGKGLDAAKLFAAAMGAIGGEIGKGIEGIRALVGYGLADPVLSFQMFASDARLLVQEIVRAANDFDEKGLDAAKLFAAAMGAIGGEIGKGVGGIKALAGYGQTDPVQGFNLFAQDARRLVDAIVAVALFFDAKGLEAATAFATATQKVVGFVQPSLAAIAALAAYQSAAGIGAATQRFAADILVVADELRTGLGNATPEMLAALAAAQQFAAAVQPIFGFIKPAIDSMYELRDYARPYGVGTGIVTLLRDVQTLVEWLDSFASSIGTDTLAAAAEFASVIAVIVASMTAALGGFAEMEANGTAWQSAAAIGQSWMQGLIDGLTERLGDLQALMGYIRGLFPSSPAEHGPWSDLPDGHQVGSAWGLGLAAGVGSTIRPLTSVLAGLQSSMALTGSSLPGARGGSVVNAPLTVNVGGTWNVRQESDIRKVAEEVGAVMSQQAGINRRMNLAWSAM